MALGCPVHVFAHKSSCLLHAGDTGLEIAPGSDTENAEALIADPGNIWNGVPQVGIIVAHHVQTHYLGYA